MNVVFVKIVSFGEQNWWTKLQILLHTYNKLASSPIYLIDVSGAKTNTLLSDFYITPAIQILACC